MPERKKPVVRVDASAIQGEGAWIEFTSYTWKERRERVQPALEAYFSLRPSDISGANGNFNQFLMEEMDTQLCAWNLVNEHGDPLEVDVGLLYDEERKFCFTQLQRLITQTIGDLKQDEDLKN